MIKLAYINIIILLTTLELQATDMRSLFFHGNCTTCHFETKAHSAPSIVEIKQRYKSAFASKEEFVGYMSNWVLKPDASTSLMDEAIKKYELMPELGYDLNTLKEISAYIYETNFNKEHEGHKIKKKHEH